MIEEFLAATNHLPQPLVADRTGIAQATISRWRRGQRAPLRHATRERIRDFLSGGRRPAPQPPAAKPRASDGTLVLPSTDHLAPAARALVAGIVGEWMLRGWPQDSIEHAAELLVAPVRALLRLQRELSEADQVEILSGAAEDIAERYTEDGQIVRQQG